MTENLRCARRHASQSEKFAVNEGLDAPTPARVVGLPPRRGSTFFRSERKYQRKHAARRLREKGFYCPFCRRGSQRRAQWSWTAIPNACARSCARLFPPSKWAGLFPSAAYRRSAPPQLALGRLNQRELGYYVAAWVVSPHRKTDLIFSHYGWHYAYSISAAWHVSVQIEYFCNAKGQRGFKSTLAFWASRRACRPTAVFSIQLAGNHTRLASRETRCRAAVKPRPTGMSLYAPARQGRAEMGAGL